MGLMFKNLFGKKTQEAEKQQILEREWEEQRKLEEKEAEIKRLSEDVTWFKRLMAHNVRMPLAVMVGYGELLAESNFSTREEELECISKICKNIDYLNTVFKVLLDNNEEEFLEKKHFDILDCAREVSEYVKMIAKKAGIKISVNSSREEVMLYGNRISLMRAFFNLIENSVRYMNREGNIFITVEETEKEILVVYRDDGEGMQADQLETIAELGFRGKNGKPGGYGIGMYLVRQAVEEQGGSLEVKSGEGNGMGIYMSFPKNRQNL